MSRNKTETLIFGSKYIISGSEPEEYIQKVAAYLDNRMREISDLNKSLGGNMIAILAAINVVDEYFKCRYELENAINKRQEDIEEDRNNYINIEKDLKKEINKLKLSLAQLHIGKSREIDELTNDYHNRELKYKKEIDKLKFDISKVTDTTAKKIKEVVSIYDKKEEKYINEIEQLKTEIEYIQEEKMIEIEKLKDEYKQMEELWTEEYDRILKNDIKLNK